MLLNAAKDKCQFFEKINKINKCLPRRIKRENRLPVSGMKEGLSLQSLENERHKKVICIIAHREVL